MLIQMVGTNYRSAPIELREKLSFTPDMLETAYKNMQAEWPHQQGVVVVSTCNRTEIYVAGNVSYAEIINWWARQANVLPADLQSIVYTHQQEQAARHLFRVASGLDSMVLGETQILGQVKDAFMQAQMLHVDGRLHRLFDSALNAAKRAHAETGISKNALSIGHAVVELAHTVFSDLSARTVLII
ncbi:MAG: glutamyl-tRNA reductase, partial [Firmicutes bacterium]|nr:glutamyl-tRNA reductase [Bacillota bacterium]